MPLGHAIEEVQLEDADQGDIRYWRDDTGTHHVPKLLADQKRVLMVVTPESATSNLAANR